MNKKKMCDYSKNIFSQFGEDGIIEKAFQIIGTSSRVCIEFGAWDGLFASNTANLWMNGWKGILIEADKTKYEALVRNTAGYDCTCIHAFVSYKGEHTLERLLKGRNLLQEVDFLSIDVDGDDYFILESLTELRPRLISCEYNPTIPPNLELVPEAGNYFGSSVLSLEKLAKTKGYRLVALTETNAFFVQDRDFEKFSEYETSLQSLAITKHLIYLITGYSGDYVASGKAVFGCSHPSNQKFVIGDCFRFGRGMLISVFFSKIRKEGLTKALKAAFRYAFHVCKSKRPRILL
jgi:hypothetical protein